MTAKPKNKIRKRSMYHATRDELKLIDEALAAIERGEIAGDEEVEMVFAKYRRSTGIRA